MRQRLTKTANVSDSEKTHVLYIATGCSTSWPICRKDGHAVKRLLCVFLVFSLCGPGLGGCIMMAAGLGAGAGYVAADSKDADQNPSPAARP